MIKEPKTKLCYILPEYSEKTDSHFYHLYELISKAAERMDIFLVVENCGEGRKKLSINNISRIYVQRFHFPALRVLENFLVLVWARILGYRNFYTHYSYVGAFNSSLIARLTGAKSFYWNCAANWAIDQKFRSRLGIKASVKIVNCLVIGTEGMKRGYAKNYRLPENKIKVMPNWINLKRFMKHATCNMKQETKNILFVHWLSERKGAHYLLPIYKKLATNSQFPISNFQLLIIGDGPYKDKLEQEIKENNLEDKIKLLGAVPNKDILKYFTAADVFLMPSREEGFPRVLLEAMAAGIPYVASNIGGVKEISPPAAQRFIVEVGDIDGYAERVNALLRDEKIYQEFKNEGLRWVKRYDIDKVVGIFTSLFKSV